MKNKSITKFLIAWFSCESASVSHVSETNNYIWEFSDCYLVKRIQGVMAVFTPKMITPSKKNIYSVLRRGTAYYFTERIIE